MPRPRPPYLLREHTRHGKAVWYVRKGGGPRIRIDGEYGSPAFMADYQAAVAGVTIAPAKRPADDKETLAWLLARYRESSAWERLSPATRSARDNIFHAMHKKSGDLPFSDVTREVVYEAREARKATPAMANAHLKAVRGLFKWALDAGHVKENPAAFVAPIALKSDGHHSWTDDEVARFEARWPLGTRERLAFDVLLFTGLRRGDAVRLGRQHVRDGDFRIRAEKNGVEIVAPMLAPVLRSIEAAPTGDLTFIAGEAGRPRKKAAFGNWFRDACRAADVPGAAHGLRKAGAARATAAPAESRAICMSSSIFKSTRSSAASTTTCTSIFH